MTGPRQLALGLPQAPQMGRAEFLVAPQNSDALAFIGRWPDWPGGVLALHGPAGSGKSHVAAIWRESSGAAAQAFEDVTSAQVPGLAAKPLVLDGEGAIDEAALFHLINLMREQGQSLLLVRRATPARWAVALPDLASRLKAVPAIGLAPPDDALLTGLLEKQFRDRQIRVAPEVIRYLLTRMDRSAGAARDLVGRLDAVALETRRPITVALARSVLGEDQGDLPL